jgi:2-oxoisovalerate dehydrogenase E1 component beta subunit
VTPWARHDLGEVPDGHYLGIDPGLGGGGLGDVDDGAVGQHRHGAALAPDRCVIAHEATLTSGFGAELAALVQETCFYHLEAPIVRVLADIGELDDAEAHGQPSSAARRARPTRSGPGK